MTQPGETEGYNVLDHVEALIKHTEPGLIDCIIANDEKYLNLYQKDIKKMALYKFY